MVRQAHQGRWVRWECWVLLGPGRGRRDDEEGWGALGLIMAVGPGPVRQAQGRLDAGMTLWLGADWLVERAVRGWVGSGGGPGPGMAGAGNDGGASNAISACVAGSAGKAGGDGEPGVLG